MDKISVISLIFCLYLLSTLAVSFITLNATETEFCKQNGYEEYLWKGSDLCRKKNFEENELVFENKKIYCERNLRKVFY